MHLNYSPRFADTIADIDREGRDDTTPRSCAKCGADTYWLEPDYLSTGEAWCGRCAVADWQAEDRRGAYTSELVADLVGIDRHRHPRQFKRAIAQWWADELAALTRTPERCSSCGENEPTTDDVLCWSCRDDAMREDAADHGHGPDAR